jgi:hypothetical protein
VAAVIGRVFEPRLLERATALDEAPLGAQVEDLVQRRLLDEHAHGLDFCHERIREVTYETILPSRRRADRPAACSTWAPWGR